MGLQKGPKDRTVNDEYGRRLDDQLVDTGIAGLTLGGGIGWLSRKYGLACDCLLKAEMVTASGETLTVSAAENAELFGGIRGGGGNFGVVTRFDYALYPVGPIITGGLVLFPWDRLAEIAAFYREYTRAVPDDFTTMLIGMTGPPAEWVPAVLQMQPVVAIVGCHCGDAESAEAALAPIRGLGPAVDIFGRMPYTDLQQMVDADLPAGGRYYFKGGFISSLTDEVSATIDDFMSRRPSPVNELDLHHVGGAMLASATTTPLSPTAPHHLRTTCSRSGTTPPRMRPTRLGRESSRRQSIRSGLPSSM